MIRERARSMTDLVVLLLATTPCVAQSNESATKERPIWKPVARLDPAVIQETSGIVASRKYPGVLWAHADSGNEPKLVAFDTNGARMAEVMLSGAPNIDWEDICTDDSGHLFIGDIGNNTGLLPVRYIYQVDEPDPHHPPQAPITATRSWHLRYGDGKRVNCESLFRRDGSFFVIARAPGGNADVFRLAEKGERDLELQSAAALPMSAVSAADTSPDGTTLMACTVVSARLFAFTGDGEFVNSTSRRLITFPLHGSVEACCFDGADAVLVAENGDMYRVPLAYFEAQTRFR